MIPISNSHMPNHNRIAVDMQLRWNNKIKFKNKNKYPNQNVSPTTITTSDWTTKYSYLYIMLHMYK